jgi:hypothetical protein
MTENKFKKFLFKMDVSKDYYTILGILPSAEVLVIKAAYKAMLKIYHPDKFKGTKEESHLKTVNINEAYLILSSKDTRDEYDKLRAVNSNDNFFDEEASSFNSDFSTHQSSKERSIKPYKLLRSINWNFSALPFLLLLVLFAAIDLGKTLFFDNSVSLFLLLIILANSIGTALVLNPKVDFILGFMPITIHRKSPTAYALVITNSLLGAILGAMSVIAIVSLVTAKNRDAGLGLGIFVVIFIYFLLLFANARSLWELRKA